MEERINGNRDMDTGRDVCPWQAAGGGGEAVFRILFKRRFGSWKDCIYAGICRRSRCGRPVDSPTFTIVKQYDDGRMPFYHFDVYRIGDISEMDEIGYEDCFYGDGVSLVEWGGLIEEILPEDVITVKIEKDLEKGFDYRRITVEGLE